MTSDERFLEECEEYIRTLPDGQMSVQVYRNPFIRLVSLARQARPQPKNGDGRG